jgi:hypothetical protein
MARPGRRGPACVSGRRASARRSSRGRSNWRRDSQLRRPAGSPKKSPAPRPKRMRGATARHAPEPAPPTSTTVLGFPNLVTTRYELAQSLDAGIAGRLRLKVGEDSLKGPPRCRPIVGFVVQHPSRVEKHPVYDLGNREHNVPHAFHNASHVFSPARVSHRPPQMRRRRNHAHAFRFGTGAVGPAATMTRAAPNPMMCWRRHLPPASVRLSRPSRSNWGIAFFSLTRALSVPASLLFPAFPWLRENGRPATPKSGLKFLRSTDYAATLMEGGRGRQGI